MLAHQVRDDNTAPEDEWFGKSIANMRGLKVASGEDSKRFSVEEVFHEKPMGYHVRDFGGGRLAEPVWKNHEQRKKILNYCPEVAIIMDMKLQRERCEGDNLEGKIEESPPLDHRAIHERDYIPAWRNEMLYSGI